MSRYLIAQLEARANIRMLVDSEVVAAHGEVSLEEIDVRHRDQRRDHATARPAACTSSSARTPQTDWLPPEIALDEQGYVLTGSEMRATGRWTDARDPYLLETSVPGIFACGDVRFGPVKRVAAAVGEGSMCIAFVHQYLKDAEAAPAPAA